MVTSGLPYANGHLHVGHIAGAYLPADIFVRYHRACGNEILFVCGSDDNGVPNTLAARKEGTTPDKLVARYNESQKKSFDGLGIGFDIYGGTHSPQDVEYHNKLSQHFFLTALDKGYLSKRKTRQLYDPQAQMFLPDRYVKGTCHHCKAPGALGDQCESCGKMTDALLLINPVSAISGAKPEVRETTHWFFELDKFRKPLRAWLESKKDEWRPAVLNFAMGLLEQELPARSITRDLSWGVSVPLDEPEAQGKVLYVWFDAPIGYVSFTGRVCRERFGDAEKYAEWWKNPDCPVIHFIGEDNTVFHAIIWPAMLMAEETFQLPTDVVANCFLNFQFPGKEEEKMSKSRGTAVWIHEYLERFDPDPLRYYLTAIAPETQRTAFSFEDFISRNNDELVAALGNFFHRTMTFIGKYFDGKVPQAELKDVDQQQLSGLKDLPARIGELIEEYGFRAAQGELMAAARAANKYFDTKQPWSTRKSDMADCGTTMNVCVQTLRTLTTVMQPFLPFAAANAAKMLNLATPGCFAWQAATEPIAAGSQLGQAEILFKKLEPDEVGDKANG